MGENSSSQVVATSPLDVMLTVCDTFRGSQQMPLGITEKKLNLSQKDWSKLTKKCDSSVKWPKKGSFDPNKLAVLRAMIGENPTTRPYIKFWKRVGRHRANATGHLQAYMEVLPPVEEREGLDEFIETLFTSNLVPAAPPPPQQLHLHPDQGIVIS